MRSNSFDLFRFIILIIFIDYDPIAPFEEIKVNGNVPSKGYGMGYCEANNLLYIIGGSDAAGVFLSGDLYTFDLGKISHNQALTFC
jgi:hypothetical protein